MWARACLNIVGLVGRHGGRSDMYLSVSHWMCVTVYSWWVELMGV